ncbi:MAG: bifunctional 5,10-methylenetetrahydrofolate dehydrogenase/5,10-methenyltetrahydrofolate cyclohydrolase [Opitutales bacterium]|nr:bifunctional 5,10-methylenetetrahydrofolate dehydrogenase/5,10-methenyltetrahydrofolate cyclohydrolase [Opitutales bacterium]
MQLIDGNQIAGQIFEDLKISTARLLAEKNIVPHIVVLRVGNDPASVSYVKRKEKAAAEIGFRSTIKVLPETATQSELEALIDIYNADPAVHGILIQSPLPLGIDETAIFNRVVPEKDVDGFSTVNVGKLVQELPDAMVPCTPAGIMELLRRTGTQIKGAHAVVVGRSQIVGKAIANLLVAHDASATVTICHSATKDMAAITRTADILIVAIGKPHFVRADMVKAGAVVIDVGINRVPDASKKNGFRLVGDVDFDNVAPLCERITPVPGGVGPMTVAMLMKNTFKAATRLA